MSHSNFALKGSPDPAFSSKISAGNGDLAIPFEQERAAE
jgi:hypothetical protein